MFSKQSRYAGLVPLISRTPDGCEIAYLPRRFSPQPESLITRSSVTVRSYDRMDLITWRALRDPELFWRICDANGILDPFEAAAEPGRVLRVPGPQSRSSGA